MEIWLYETHAARAGIAPPRYNGHANTNDELVAAARAQIASLQAGQPSPDS
jgi:hypothetical protein